MSLVVASEQPIAGALDVSAGEGARELGIGGRDRVENALVLGDDIVEGEQSVRLHLPRAQLDLSHE